MLSPPGSPTAAALVIGDEILSGKVAEANLAVLIPALRRRGVRLRRVAMVGDEVAAIAAEVAACAASHDVVITSGGIGPTHDDLTVTGVARAFGLPLVRSAELEAIVRERWGKEVNEAALRMADVPAGARLIPSEDGLLPLVVVRNVYLLPGVPSLFERKLAVLLGELGEHSPPFSLTLTVSRQETAIAATLDAVAAAFPEVKIGSYPQENRTVWITLEGDSTPRVRQAYDRLRCLLGDSSAFAPDARESPTSS